MKNLLIILLTAVTIGVAYANTTDKMKDTCTSAEEDFISACIEKETACFSNNKTGCCVPEVIIIDQHDEIFSKGDRDNNVIKRFMLISDFLTEVQGTVYYRMNTMIADTQKAQLAQK